MYFEEEWKSTLILKANYYIMKAPVSGVCLLSPACGRAWERGDSLACTPPSAQGEQPAKVT